MRGSPKRKEKKGGEWRRMGKEDLLPGRGGPRGKGSPSQREREQGLFLEVKSEVSFAQFLPKGPVLVNFTSLQSGPGWT